MHNGAERIFSIGRVYVLFVANICDIYFKVTGATDEQITANKENVFFKIIFHYYVYHEALYL